MKKSVWALHPHCQIRVGVMVGTPLLSHRYNREGVVQGGGGIGKIFLAVFLRMVYIWLYVMELYIIDVPGYASHYFG